MRAPERRLNAVRRLAVVLSAALLAVVTAPAPPTATEGEASAGLAGRLLVAREDLRDPNFHQSVVYMLEHDSRGAMGLVINRPIGSAAVAELLKQMGVEGESSDAEIPIHFGGPVEPSRGFLLHSDDAMLEGSQGLPGGFAVTGDPEMLRRIARGEGPRNYSFLLGYAGWAPGQLEREIARGTWWDIEADPALVFEADSAAIWQRAIDLRGLDL